MSRYNGQRKETSHHARFNLAQGSHQMIKEYKVGNEDQQENWETDDNNRFRD